MKNVLLLIAFACIAAPSLHAKETSETQKPSIEVVSKFIELPDAMAAALKLPGNQSFIDKAPDKRQPETRSSLRAVLDEKDAEEFTSTLLAQKDVDLCTSPRVVAYSEMRAVIEIIRELRYPTEFDPPTEKEKHWTPKAFETRNVGATLEVIPTLTPEGQISLKVEPSVVEFLGFVDYETDKPVFTTKADLTKPFPERAMGSSMAFKPTGHPTKPVFSTRKATVEVTITPGQTVVMDLLGESEKIEPFAPVRPGYRIIVRASIMPSPDKSVAKK